MLGDNTAHNQARPIRAGMVAQSTTSAPDDRNTHHYPVSPQRRSNTGRIAAEADTGIT